MALEKKRLLYYDFPSRAAERALEEKRIAHDDINNAEERALNYRSIGL